MSAEYPYTYKQTSTADAETVLRAFPGKLAYVLITTKAAGSLTLRDDLATGGSNIIAVIDTNAADFMDYEAWFNRGLTYAKTGTAAVTICYL